MDASEVVPKAPKVQQENFLLVDVPFTPQGQELIRLLQDALRTKELPFFPNGSGAGLPHFPDAAVESPSSATEMNAPEAYVEEKPAQSTAVLLLLRQEGWPPPPG